MKYIAPHLFFIALLLAWIAPQTIPVFGADPDPVEGQVQYGNKTVQKQTDAFTGSDGADFGRVKDPRIVVASLIQSFLVVLGILFLVYMTYAGYLIMTSAGNDDRIDKGKSITRNAVIGVMLVLGAYGTMWIVRWVFVASGDETYKECYPPDYEEYNSDPLAPRDDRYKNC
ncbi:MAG: hypothetical protein COV60_03300 [Candidatus Magasanikbacteria bacterium CG11_big_fil_rev_8_21_14_0_20_43_7]|uniref:Uncharacterized protein n=1 Tax=Candidatus Magasanikbacteria bacterium CG11_big_fil_rev_8_21_14_0_20_43_7 TaxID=1974654 RepID=A0A2H0N1V4_9BACT|nr:MAG: hypothetical protein COV60_03300 [Candidatus Magasanikbacteria bacterium CG11_big_fil_rev_8_21_14_0_20_43_7]